MCSIVKRSPKPQLMNRAKNGLLNGFVSLLRAPINTYNTTAYSRNIITASNKNIWSSTPIKANGSGRIEAITLKTDSLLVRIIVYQIGSTTIIRTADRSTISDHVIGFYEMHACNTTNSHIRSLQENVQFYEILQVVNLTSIHLLDAVKISSRLARIRIVITNLNLR